VAGLATPSNPIAAAADGAIVPLILFTLLLALAIARSPAPARTSLVGFFDALAAAMLLLVRWVVLLAPIGIFGLVLPLAAHAGAAIAGAIGFYIGAYSLACILVALLLYPVVALFARISVGRGPVSWTVGALFVGWFYGIPLHIQQLATVAFAAVFLGFIGPGVPRGAFIMLTPLFAPIGLPAEGIGILIAVDAIPDNFSTVLNLTGDLAAAALVSGGARAAELNDGPSSYGGVCSSSPNPTYPQC
jgi:Na+/H+-dicarboxylate symporter